MMNSQRALSTVSALAMVALSAVLAWRSAPVQRLPDLSRSHANTKEMDTTMAVKHVRPYHVGVPLL